MLTVQVIPSVLLLPSLQTKAILSKVMLLLRGLGKPHWIAARIQLARIDSFAAVRSLTQHACVVLTSCIPTCLASSFVTIVDVLLVRLTVEIFPHVTRQHSEDMKIEVRKSRSHRDPDSQVKETK